MKNLINDFDPNEFDDFDPNEFDDFDPNEFDIPAKHPSEDALKKWRNQGTFVRNKQRRFLYVPNFDKRTEAKEIEKLRVKIRDANIILIKKYHREQMSIELAEKCHRGNARPTALARKSFKMYKALVNSIKPHDTGRIWPDHLDIDQVHAQDPEIASSSADVEPQIASSGVTSSSGVCASVHDRLLQSSNGADARTEIRDHGNDNASVHGRRLQLNEPESSNGADARSEIRDHGNDNAAQRMRTDFQSDTRDPGADARSEISDHNSEMSDHGGDDPIEIRLEVSDHGDDDDPIETRPEESDHVGEMSDHGGDDPIEIRLEVSDHGDDDPIETRPEESDHVGGHLNAIVAQVGGQAVVNLMASHSPDSPFLRLFAVFAGCSFVGSLYANSLLKNQKVAEYLTKFSVVCLLFAVNIALGVNVLEGTKWHLNIVVTVALCIASVALVAWADIGLPTAPASNQSRTSRQTLEASSSSQAPNSDAALVARRHAMPRHATPQEHVNRNRF